MVSTDGYFLIPTIYSNVARLAIGKSDCALEFGFVTPGDPDDGTAEWEPMVRVIMSATQLGSLLSDLHGQLSGQSSDTFHPLSPAYQSGPAATNRDVEPEFVIGHEHNSSPNSGSPPPPNTAASLNSRDIVTPETDVVGAVEAAPPHGTVVRVVDPHQLAVGDSTVYVPSDSDSGDDKAWIRQPDDARWNYRDEQLWAWENEDLNSDERP